MDDIRVVLTIVAALGSGLIGGVFFAFSTFVMKSLAAQLPAQGIATMQSINVTVLNRWFLSSFLGTAVACAVLAVASLADLGETDVLLQIAGSLLYIVGCFGVTMAFNVPRNNALAAVDADSTGGAALWAEYVTDWTAWNTVRSVASLLAAVAFCVALVVE